MKRMGIRQFLKVKWFLLVIAAIALSERTYFNFVVKPEIYQFYREVGEARYIEAIAEFNTQSLNNGYIEPGKDKALTLPLPELIPQAEAQYQAALIAFAHDRRATWSPSLMRVGSAKTDCFRRVYCVEATVRLSGDGSGKLGLLGFRSLFHSTRILAPRAENLDPGIIGKTVHIAKFSISEETEWLYPE